MKRESGQNILGMPALRERENIDNFLRRTLKPLSQHVPNLFPVLVAHRVSLPRVMEYTQQQGIAVDLSYDF